MANWLFIDDLRDPPEGDWVVVRDADAAFRALVGAHFDVVSCDNDLGEDENGLALVEGREILNWIEEQAVLNDYPWPPEIRVHTANTCARDYMERTLKARGYRFNGSATFNDGHDAYRVWRR